MPGSNAPCASAGAGAGGGSSARAAAEPSATVRASARGNGRMGHLLREPTTVLPTRRRCGGFPWPKTRCPLPTSPDCYARTVLTALGPYRLISGLGAGGMGRVYLAETEGG